MDLDVLFKDDSFKVLSHRCSINNEEVNTFQGYALCSKNILNLIQ